MSHSGQYLCFCVFLFLFVHQTSSEICTNQTCRFTLHVARQQTMTYQSPAGDTLNVQLNGSQLQIVGNEATTSDQRAMIGQFVSHDDDVITADGYKRDIITINGQFPGPTLEVLEGSEIKVEVENTLYTEAITIHWHGIHQVGTPWDDGVPYVTSCPILPGQSYNYSFKALPSGTHWYHSHFYNQRLDGLFGMIIVHQSEPVLPYFVFSLMDWYHQSATSMKVSDPFDKGIKGSGDGYLAKENQRHSVDGVSLSSIDWVSGLINGRGRMKEGLEFPLAEFIVEDGYTYLFRSCHTGAEYAFEISIDAHDLYVVALDGRSIRQINVDSIIIYPGECIDFEMDASPQSHNEYWIHAQTLDADSVYGVKGVLRYSDGNKTTLAEPASIQRVCTEEHPCFTFNCPFSNDTTNKHKLCISASEAQSIEESMILNQDKEPIVLFYNFDFSVGSSVNSHQWVSPKELLIGRSDPDDLVTKCSNNCSMGCQCTYTENLPLNQTVQMIFSSLEPASIAPTHHSIHLHGYNFVVLKIGYPEYNETTGQYSNPNSDIICGDPNCSTTRWTDSNRIPSLNYHSPPIRDTIVVPAGGYVVIQLITTNPGYWLLHCHQELHLEEGMIMMINVSGQKQDVPDKVSSCSLRRGITSEDRSDTISDVPFEDLAKSSIAVLVAISSLLLVLLASLTLWVYCSMPKHMGQQYAYSPLIDQELENGEQMEPERMNATTASQQSEEPQHNSPAVIDTEQSTFEKDKHSLQHAKTITTKKCK